MKEVYALEFDNGQDYEMNDREIFAVCDTYEKAVNLIKSLGFESFENSSDVFIRNHDDVPNECIAHSDYVFIHTIPLNDTKKDIEHIARHYKKEEAKMINEYYFSFNEVYGKDRKEPLHVERFLNDLKEVFEKHKVTSIENGITGFHKDGKFGISKAQMNISEED